jgi:crossover junction endodeoxyribonuclease RusA
MTLSYNAHGRAVAFDVVGIAQPKGSARAFLPKGWKRPIITSDNPKIKGWQQLVAERAQTVAHEGFFTGAVVVLVWFYLPRPMSLPKRVIHATKLPDVDKLARGVLDALTGILFRDDAQVVAVHAFKQYARDNQPPYVHIAVCDAPPPKGLAESVDLFAEPAR